MIEDYCGKNLEGSNLNIMDPRFTLLDQLSKNKVE